MTNRQRLIKANIVDPKAIWTQQQTEAIEDLTEEEIDALISVKEKIDDVFPLAGEAVPPVLRFS